MRNHIFPSLPFLSLPFLSLSDFVHKIKSLTDIVPSFSLCTKISHPSSLREWGITPWLFTMLATQRQNRYATSSAEVVYNGLKRTLTGVLEDRHPWTEKVVWMLNATQVLLSYNRIWHIRHIWRIISGNIFMNFSLISFENIIKQTINRIMHKEFILFCYFILFILLKSCHLSNSKFPLSVEFIYDSFFPH